MAALTTSTLADAAAPHQRWVLKLAIHYLPRVSNHSEYTKVLVAGRTVWFFGGSNVAGRGVPEVEQRTDRRWRSPTLPAGLHTWISGASAAGPGDIWAVTYLGGKVLHFNGVAWSVMPKGSWNPRARFTSLVAFGPQNVWLFGSKGDSHPGAGTWHLAGTKWTESRGTGAHITMASATSPRDMWGIGSIGGMNNALLRFRGNRWLHEKPASLAGFVYSLVLVLGPSSVWVAGLSAGNPQLAHYDGRGWTRITVPGFFPATGMCPDGRGGLWVIANSGFGASVVMNRSGRGVWTSAPVSKTSADEVLSCAVVPGRTAAWGAGKAAAPAGTAAAAYGYGKVR